MRKILVIHGPNLNLLGAREPDIYGKNSLDDINNMLEEEARSLGVEVVFFQSNHEGEIVQKIQDAKKEKISAILINPAAYTHTSVAIRDAISAVAQPANNRSRHLPKSIAGRVGIPVIEVHLSNIYAREEFRRISLISPVAAGVISGFGHQSYIFGLKAAAEIVKKA